MNFFKVLMLKLMGINKGDAAYHAVINAGKLASPIVTPIVTNYLASQGLPATPQAALYGLVTAATDKLPLGAEIAAGLSQYVGGTIALVTPQPAP